MRNTIIVLTCCGLQLAGLAQPIFNNSDIGLVDGNEYTLISGESSFFPSNISGTNQSWTEWDLYSLSNTTTSNYIVHNSSSVAFPAATHYIEKSGTNIYRYYKSNYNELSYSGFSVNGNSEYYSNSKMTVDFPMSFGDTYSDTYLCDYVQVNGGHTVVDGTISGEVVGHGNLETASGIIDDVLVLKTVENENSYYEPAGGTGVTTLIERETYYWFASGHKWPLVTCVQTSYNGGVPSYSAEYYQSIGAKLENVAKPSTNFKMWPIPCSDVLHIENGMEYQGKVEILDLLGQIVLSFEGVLIDGIVDVSTLPAGYYGLKTDNDHIERFVKQ